MLLIHSTPFCDHLFYKTEVHTSQPQWRVTEPGSKVLIPRERTKNSFLVQTIWAIRICLHLHKYSLSGSKQASKSSQASQRNQNGGPIIGV